MSIRVMSWVWDNGPEKGSDLLVLLALADFANDEGECWPSMASIARKARMTERGAQKIARRLAGDGYLEITTGGGRHGCNRYRLIRKETPNGVRPYGAPETPNDVRPFEQETPNAVHPRTSFAPEQRDTKPRTARQETPNGRSPEPSRTTIEPSYPPVAPQPEPMPAKARLPEDWAPDDDDWVYAKSPPLNLTDHEIQEIADDFHAYWTDRTDAGGRKSHRGWKQAWRNRCRDVAPKFKRNRDMAGRSGTSGHGQGGSLASIAARRRASGEV